MDTLTTARTYLDLLDSGKIMGFSIDIGSDLNLEAGPGLTAAQPEWPDDDALKAFDFTTAPYWLLHDLLDTVPPVPINNAEELAGYLL